MKRETGLRRASLITGALVAASVAGTVAVGVAAYAADSAQTSETSTSTSDSGSASSSTDDSSSNYPSLSGGSSSDSSSSSQATSGGVVTCHSSRHCRSARTPRSGPSGAPSPGSSSPTRAGSARRPTSSKPSWPPSTWRAARFRSDSELRVACWAGGRPVTVSPLLARLVSAALDAARDTDCAVDPTVGGALCGLGYDRDYAGHHRAGGGARGSGVRHPGLEGRAPHRSYADGSRGVLLDLGATAKAVAADRAAARVAERLDVGVLVALGGDNRHRGTGAGGRVAGAGAGPAGDPADTVRLPAGAALATSSTAGRTWGSPRRTAAPQIVDPRTGRPAETVWRTVSVAAYSCLRANTLSTAAIVRGHAAP